MTRREEFEEWFNDFNDEARLDAKDRELMFVSWQAAKARAVPQWISVEDQLPNHDAGKWSNPVIALSDIGLVFRLSYCGGWQRTGDFMSTGSSKVTHWMPLPAAPVQAKDGE